LAQAQEDHLLETKIAEAKADKVPSDRHPPHQFALMRVLHAIVLLPSISALDAQKINGMLMRSEIRKHKARTSSLDTSIDGKAAAYTKHGGKFVKWGKCSQKQRGCSKVYAVCAAAAQADCSADSSCRALAVKKLGGHVYIKYTDSGCVAENTYDDRHWDMYFQATVCEGSHGSLNTCLAKHCGSRKPDKRCLPCEQVTKAMCNRNNFYGCIYTKSGCQSELQMNFGGRKHSEKNAWINRPEEVRSEICRSGKCEGCTSSSACWHGTGSAFLKVQVPAGTDRTQTVRSAHIWLRCGVNAGEKFDLSGERITNSRVDAFVDGRKQSSTVQTQKWFTLDVPKDGADHIVVLEHIVLQRGSVSEATIRFVAHMQPWVDQCLSKKVCLAALGDGSGTSFAMRNSNQRQYNCLNGRPAAEDKQQCAAWVRCLVSDEAKDPSKLLKAMLNVALGKKGNLLAQTESLVGKVSVEKCIDPYVADAEAWECECMEELEKTCGSQNDMEQCFHKIMCKNPNICCAWKQDNCPNAHCQPKLMSSVDATGSIKEAGAVMSRRAERNDTGVIDSLLDSSLSGKCAEQ